MKIDLQTAIGLAGIALTLFFGIWSIVTGKVKAGSRFSKVFLATVFVYSGQFVSAKWLGQPLLPAFAFQSAMGLLVFWLVIAAFYDAQ